MKRGFILFLLLAGIATVSGIFMSHATWLGRVGITFFHKDYNFLKIWWQGAIAVCLIYVLVHYLQLWIKHKLNPPTQKLVPFVLLLLAIVGWYFSYDDLNNNFTHHLLGRRFRYGVYVFWLGWAIVALNGIIGRKTVTKSPTDQDRTETKDL
jgi:CDP-diglyceride synthetase